MQDIKYWPASGIGEAGDGPEKMFGHELMSNLVRDPFVSCR